MGGSKMERGPQKLLWKALVICGEGVPGPENRPGTQALVPPDTWAVGLGTAACAHSDSLWSTHQAPSRVPDVGHTPQCRQGPVSQGAPTPGGRDRERIGKQV